MFPIDLLQQAAAIIGKHQQIFILINIKACMMVKGRIEMTEKGDVQLCSGKHLKSVGLLRRLSPLQRGWENVFCKDGRKGEMSGEWSERRSVVSNSIWPNGLYSPWISPGWNTGMGSHLLLQEIFPTLGLNPGLPHCSRILYQLPGSQDKWISQIKKEYVGRLILKTTPRPHTQHHLCWAGGIFF